MRPSTKRELLGRALMALFGLHLSAQAVTPAAAPGSPPKPWILGIARFSPAKPGDPSSGMLDTLPRLIAAELRVLPLRHSPEATASESAALEDLRGHFRAGDDLASKLDARATRFLEAGADENARSDLLAAADRQVLASAKALADLDAGDKPPAGPLPDRETRLWEGHAKGLLVDTPSSSLLQTAKASGLDLLLTGTITIQSGYAIIQVRGFDAALEREVFSWKSYCSVDDPGPSAREIAGRLESWVAGRDFARLDLQVTPSSAELRVNGELFTGLSPIFYVYANSRLRLELSSSGFTTRIQDLSLALGDRKSLSLALEPLSTGRLTVISDPEGAAVSLDSVPLGRSPLGISLDGSRGIATFSAEGRETESLVLPASGESDLRISLLPSDGLGPSGRIAASKDRFYQSLGWLVLSIPATSLTAGLFRAYDETYYRSGDAGILVSRGVSVGALAVAIAATGTTAVITIIRLVKYLGAAH